MIIKGLGLYTLVAACPYQEDLNLILQCLTSNGIKAYFIGMICTPALELMNCEDCSIFGGGTFLINLACKSLTRIGCANSRRE